MTNFSKDTSRFKMVIYLKDRTTKVFYSLDNEEKKSSSYAIRGMVRRLLEKLYLNKYTTSIIYDMTTGEEVEKYISGRKVSCVKG